MNEAARQWFERAQYDMETARAMCQSGRYLYVLFCCQQAVEKALKGLIALRSGELPPRLHNLARLAELAGLSPDEEQAQTLRELSAYYIQTRYPDELPDTALMPDQEEVHRILTRSEEMLQWLRSMLS